MQASHSPLHMRALDALELQCTGGERPADTLGCKPLVRPQVHHPAASQNFK